MQQKHKKAQARPIVPVHAAAAPAAARPAIQRAAKPAGSTKPTTVAAGQKPGAVQQKPQQQLQLQQQEKPAGLGKRRQLEGAPQPPAKKQHQQPGGQQAGRASHQQQQQQQQQPKQQQRKQDMKQQPGQHVQQALQVPKQQQQQYFKKRSSKPKRTSGRAAAAGDAVDDTAQQAGSAAAAAAAADTTPAAGAVVNGAAVLPAPAPAPAAAAGVAKPWQQKQPASISSNWQALKQRLAAEQAAKPQRPRRGLGKAPVAAGSSSTAAKKQIGSIGHNKDATPIVAMDCEMVGVGPGGERDSLARVSIVNAAGNVLLDSFVAQKEPVTDYRTWVSGVTAESLQGAPELAEVQKSVAELLQARTLVGHGLSKDLRVLMLSHPRKAIRDTAKYPPFMFSKGGKRRPRALRHLALQELGLAIQEGQHSSVDDARAALYLYQKHAAVWERALKTPLGLKELPTANRPASKKKRVESYRLRDVQDDPMADL